MGQFLHKLHSEVCVGRQHHDFNIDNVYYDPTRHSGDKVMSIDNSGLDVSAPIVSDARFIYQESVAEVPHLKGEILKVAVRSTRCSCQGCRKMMEWVCQEINQ